MLRVRPPAVAGVFYPADPTALRLEVCRLLEEVVPAPCVVTPRALIVPHAGFRYSGPIAASAYARLATLKGVVRTVVLVGPAHYGDAKAELSLSGADAFATPLGRMEVDRALTARARALPDARVHEAVHAPEHCLEVQLPFIQLTLGEIGILPVLAGPRAEGAVEDLLALVWDDRATLIVVSSDLSHYLRYERAAARDRATAAAVQALDADAIAPEAACGCAAMRGLVRLAARGGLAAAVLDLRNSGDTGGDRTCVVGYGAFALGVPS